MYTKKYDIKLTIFIYTTVLLNALCNDFTQVCQQHIPYHFATSVISLQPMNQKSKTLAKQTNMTDYRTMTKMTNNWQTPTRTDRNTDTEICYQHCLRLTDKIVYIRKLTQHFSVARW